ncbi:MAG: DUF262 domain-containing protein [Gammaproteobacteria bacterium]|nr:MAG: DUF262 domain-containing protein [Gammaproteobacteria bacterium]
MSTFDSTKTPLIDLLRDITTGKIQLPDFQRGWVWDDDHIQDLLVSVARSFPIGAVMLLENGGEVRFQTRPVEGVERHISNNVQPEKLILDGQQRLTTLTQAIALQDPVQTRTKKGKAIQRYYYFNIRSALDNPTNLEDALVAVDENRQIRTNFGREVELDLSTRELECQQLYFPCNQIIKFGEWMKELRDFAPEHLNLFIDFHTQVIDIFHKYHLPIIELNRQTSKEAVCLVFEKVNTGGVSLSVFELVTASYAADSYNLRDDWFGSEIRSVSSRKERLEEELLLKGIEAPEFLQAVTLIHTHELRKADLDDGKTGKQVRPISAKRSEVLNLPLNAWEDWANEVEQGFKLAAKFLRQECIYDRRELPYSTQLIPLAAVMARIDDRWREPRIYDKLARWYWCGVLGELYSGAVETRIANDYEELLAWFENDDAVPRTVNDASFQPERLDNLRSRNSAAYKGINVLVLRKGARDWFWKATIHELDTNEVALDIHHIFPKAWCEANAIKRDVYDSILNKTPISYLANRKIGGDAPSRYLRRIQNEPQVRLTDPEMDELLESHALSAELLRSDKFSEFLKDRRSRLLEVIEQAMGKKIVHLQES